MYLLPDTHVSPLHLWELHVTHNPHKFEIPAHIKVEPLFEIH